MHTHTEDDLHTKLEPIHYRMYKKVQAVDGLAREIAAFGDERGWTQEAASQLDQTHPHITGELIDHVEFPWVHDGIAALVDAAESTLAAACAPLSSHMDEVVNYVRDLGAQAAHSAQLDGSLQSAWSALDDCWLDGMPCDGFIRLISNQPARIEWRVDLSPHPAASYERIRNAWTDGFMEAAGIDFTVMGDGTYRITKAA